MKKPSHLILPLLIASALGSQGAVITLANYTFDHASGSLPAGWNSDSAAALHVTASNVGIVGASFANNTANLLRFTDTATTSFTTATNYMYFQLTADSGYYFDLTDVESSLRFTVDRVSGDSPQEAQMQLFAGTDATGTLLATSSLGSSTGSAVTVTDTGAISSINSTNQYDEIFVQVQWRGDSSPDSSAWTFDNFRIQGNVTAIPEPTTWSVLLGGMAMLALVRRRK